MKLFSQLSPEERDARLTSLLLGELPAAEAEELRRTIAADPELSRTCERRERTITMLREAACRQFPVGESRATERQEEIPVRLSEDRRAKLLETFRSPAPVSNESLRRRIPTWFVPMTAAALLIALLSLAALLPQKRSVEAEFALLTSTRARDGSTFTERSATPSPTDQPAVVKEVMYLSDNRGQISGQPTEVRNVYDMQNESQAMKKKGAVPAPAKPAAELNLDAVTLRAEGSSVAQPRPKVEIAGNEYFTGNVSEWRLTPPDVTVGAREESRTPPPPVIAPAALPSLDSRSEVARSGNVDAITVTHSNLKEKGATVYSFSAVGYVDVNGLQFNAVTNSVANFAGADGLPATAPVPSRASGFGGSALPTTSGTPLTVIADPVAKSTPAPARSSESVLGGARFEQGIALNGVQGRTLGETEVKEPEINESMFFSGTNVNAQSLGLARNNARGLEFDWYFDGWDSRFGGRSTQAPTHFYENDFSGGKVKQFAGSNTADDRAGITSDFIINPVPSQTSSVALVFGDTLNLYSETQLGQLEGRPQFDFGNVTGAEDREWNPNTFRGAFKPASGEVGGFVNRPISVPSNFVALSDFDTDGSFSLTPQYKNAGVGSRGRPTLERTVAEQNVQTIPKLEQEKLDKKPVATPTNASAPVPQPELLARDNAFSTFSLNVSDVSFKLAAASLEKGTMPEAASIRSEEFINAFDYRDPQPPRGAPIGFAWDRARYPFAHNRDVVRFSVKTAAQGRESGKPLNIVLLLDNSGSMERADRVRIIQESLRSLAGQLKPQDKLSVVTFARTATLRADGLTGTNALEAVKQIGVITPEGGTNLEDALDLAYWTALRHYQATAVNRVVLLTDGAANLGNVEPKALKEKVEGFRKQGIALDCFGIGWEGFNDELLEQLSRNGDGRYGFVNTPEEAASEFVGQLAGALQVAASDVKMQVEFNPRRVTAYRQIGYAKHQLTKEQFRDNKVDAAEIGAAESGNALYVIETNPNGEGPIATVRARFRVPQTSDYREHEWVVPFGSAVELEQANPALRLSATASAFSEWLAASPFAGDVTTDRLLRILSGVPETYGADPRPRKLEWMIRQAKSISGK